MTRIGILGGTFNPLHIGHLRPVIEVFEALAPTRIDLVPCACPPHKDSSGLLPFALRVAMVEAAIAPYPFLSVNTLEAEREGPSYTYDTLRQYTERFPDARPFFILGAGDFSVLPTWYRGLEIPNAGDLVVVPRSGSEIQLFHSITQKYWPQAVPIANSQYPVLAGYRLPEGGELYFLPQPRLDISSTILRTRWCRQRDISLLVPQGVLDVLEKEQALVRTYWEAEDQALSQHA